MCSKSPGGENLKSISVLDGTRRRPVTGSDDRRCFRLRRRRVVPISNSSHRLFRHWRTCSSCVAHYVIIRDHNRPTRHHRPASSPTGTLPLIGKTGDTLFINVTKSTCNSDITSTGICPDMPNTFFTLSSLVRITGFVLFSSPILLETVSMMR